MKYDYSEKYVPEPETPTWALPSTFNKTGWRLRDTVLCVVLLTFAGGALLASVLIRIDQAQRPAPACVEGPR
jgi:hypothetical protein